MAESDDRLRRSYRDLAREEPPPALDAAILAAARASARPRARNRWAGPLSIAAVLVLGLGISLRMQVEQPGIETSLPSSPAPSEYSAPPSADVASSETAAKEAQPQVKSKDIASEKIVAKESAAPQESPGVKLSRTTPAEEQRREATGRTREQDSPPLAMLEKKRNEPPVVESARVEAKPFADAPAPAQSPPQAQASPSTPPPAAAAAPAPRESPPIGASMPAARAPAPANLGASAVSPAPLRAKREAAAAVAQDAAKPDADDRITELERIARLRADGREAEADKALEEFRRRNPDYRIPEARWERVRRR